ncbi:MAG: BrnT family toxin [Burkholderiaceae bacterium]|nr:BrnT family toxin [Burkholderiaceae bacterium]
MKNLKKHKSSFENTEFVFYDFGWIKTYDGREDYSENRWVTIFRLPAD